MSRIDAAMRAALALAAAGWLATVWALWRGPGVVRFFGDGRMAGDSPMSFLVAGLVAIALWLILRKLRRGILVGRASLWSIISGFVFTWMGGLLGVRFPGDWANWGGSLMLGIGLLALASEPFLREQE